MPQSWPNTNWTDERKELVRDMWARGHTATQIANELGIGVSRNAVIGIAHRNGFDRPLPKKTHKPRKPTPTKLLRPSPKQPRLVAIDVTPPPPPPVPTPIGELTIFQLLDHHCRWPTGDCAPYRFCGQRAADGSSYCPSCRAKSSRAT